MDLLNNFKNVVTETTQSALNKSKEIVETAKLNIAISDAETKVQKNLQNIGKIIYDAYKEDELLSEEITNKCEKIDEISENIKSLKEKIAELKNIKICSECKKENETEAVYCSKCGSQFSEED